MAARQTLEEQGNGPMGMKETLEAPKPSENTTEHTSAPKTKLRPDWQDHLRFPAQAPSKVHWALSDVYDVGGVVPRSTGPADRKSDRGVPLWGEWGVPLELRTVGASIYSLPHFWLRDNCRCTHCVNQDTMQRQLDTFSIPPDIMPSEVVTEEAGLRIKWNDDGHTSLYPWDWILKHRIEFEHGALLDTEGLPVPKSEPAPLVHWAAEIGANPPTVQYDEVMADDKGVGQWTEKIRRYGFCYVDNCPIDPLATEQLLLRIAFIRVTHYGGFYDFTSDLTMKDTAYTTLALPAHTDNTYFTDPAGLQMFHLLSHTDGAGDPDAHMTLSRTPVSWHASGNDGITITPCRKFPVFNYGDTAEGEAATLQQVRWNDADRGVVALRESDGMGAERWYGAARKWEAMLRRPDLAYWAQLEPGRALIFDNWRVLHGRSSFTGKRRMCGGYINRDDYVSRWRNTNFTREEALRQIL
ncbi:Trimethyllysine dioxygenase [Lachnellula occidentalis]|uniref:Trimethyllysine dioxygenase n=1 Tax=Lachnellula occidentalis TaxID=215460 RepID=A0A8H8UJ55_9HELO|nr:Trimethyllysine dioxygenase [Lachnellula occidentalis]